MYYREQLLPFKVAFGDVFVLDAARERLITRLPYPLIAVAFPWQRFLFTVHFLSNLRIVY